MFFGWFRFDCGWSTLSSLVPDSPRCFSSSSLPSLWFGLPVCGLVWDFVGFVDLLLAVTGLVVPCCSDPDENPDLDLSHVSTSNCFLDRICYWKSSGRGLFHHDSSFYGSSLHVLSGSDHHTGSSGACLRGLDHGCRCNHL